MNIIPMKCEICGTEGEPHFFKICPECNRLIGLECWQHQFQDDSKDNKEYPNCKHRLQRPLSTKGIRFNV